MINFNTGLTQEQARYIMEEVIPKSGWRIDRTTLGYWEKAHNYAFHEQVGQPGCSCEMVATMNVWQSRINQYRPQIEAIAYPPVVSVPSEIVVEAVIETQTLPQEIRVKTRKSKK